MREGRRHRPVIHLVLAAFGQGKLVPANMAVVFHSLHPPRHLVCHGRIRSQPVGAVLGVEDILAADGGPGARPMVLRINAVLRGGLP